MNLLQFMGALELGLLYGIVALGVFFSFKILHFPDLTVDGSFPLGAALSASLIVTGINPWYATCVALIAGFGSGFFTGLLSVKGKILHILASILVMTALYSINLRLMGRSNIALLYERTIFTDLPCSSVIFLLIIGGILILLCWRFLRSEIGLALRATGDNSMMASAQGISTSWMVCLGLAISNAFVALSGALFAQIQGFADVTMGIGTIIIGLASVILGTFKTKQKNLFMSLVGCFGGSIVYRLLITFALNFKIFGLQASDLNIVTAFLVAGTMILSRLIIKTDS